MTSASRTVADLIRARFADAQAARPVTIACSGLLLQPVELDMEGRDDQRSTIDREPAKGVGNPLGLQRGRLQQQPNRLDQHEPRQKRIGATEGAAAELVEGVVATVGQDHVVGGLGAAVVAHHRVHRPAAAR